MEGRPEGTRKCARVALGPLPGAKKAMSPNALLATLAVGAGHITARHPPLAANASSSPAVSLQEACGLRSHQGQSGSWGGWIGMGSLFEDVKPVPFPLGKRVTRPRVTRVTHSLPPPPGPPWPGSALGRG